MLLEMKLGFLIPYWLVFSAISAVLCVSALKKNRLPSAKLFLPTTSD